MKFNQNITIDRQNLLIFIVFHIHCFIWFTCAWSCKFSIGAGSLRPRVSDRNKTIAFKHANSAGSTRIDLNRHNVSCSTRISNANSCLLTLFVLPLILLQCSVTENNGQFDVSNGIHHWIAFNKNNSAHDSSNRITYNKFQSKPLFNCYSIRFYSSIIFPFFKMAKCKAAIHLLE